MGKGGGGGVLHDFVLSRYQILHDCDDDDDDDDDSDDEDDLKHQSTKFLFVSPTPTLLLFSPPFSGSPSAPPSPPPPPSVAALIESPTWSYHLPEGETGGDTARYAVKSSGHQLEAWRRRRYSRSRILAPCFDFTAFGGGTTTGFSDLPALPSHGGSGAALSVKTGDSTFEGHERIRYTRQQLLQLREIPHIPTSESLAERPGEPDCPIPHIPTSESSAERPGERDCPHYMKTQKCKFGFCCKFNNPKENLNTSVGELGVKSFETPGISILPERSSEKVCSFYMKGKCKFGECCLFHHPKDVLIPSNEQDSRENGQQEPTGRDGKTYIPVTPAILHNSKGLPIRLGETDCPFYIKTGSCKYGSACCYNHPDRNAINPPPVAGLGQSILPSAAANLSIGISNPDANFHENTDLQSAQASLGSIPTIYPQRPGEIICDFYMKTGQCKFRERCKFHHPIDQSAWTSVVKQAPQQTGMLTLSGLPRGEFNTKTGQSKFGERCKFYHPINQSAPTSVVKWVPWQRVKLTLAGLPRREGAVTCSFYMKTGTCKFGVQCKFDHPPPGEAIAMAATTTTQRSSEGGEKKDAPEAEQ